MDGTAKGGAVFGIRRELPLPVKFIGVGEGDRRPRGLRSPTAFVDAILTFDETPANAG